MPKDLVPLGSPNRIPEIFVSYKEHEMASMLESVKFKVKGLHLHMAFKLCHFMREGRRKRT